MIITDNIEKAKRMIMNQKDKPIILMANGDIFNRKMIEYGKFDVIVGLERRSSTGNLRQIDSGLNHVLAKEATKNKIKIGIDLKDLRELTEKEKSERIMRIKQNIKICKKADTDLILLNIKDKKDAFSFLLDLGASSQQAKKAISF